MATERKYSRKQAVRRLRQWLDSRNNETTLYYGYRDDGIECKLIPINEFRAVIEALEQTIPRLELTETK